jgi:integrase
VAPQTFPEAADANAWLSVVDASIAGGEWRAPELSKEAFGSYGRRWLTERLDLRPSTRELYGTLWRRWLEPSFGEVPLGALSTESWRAWYLRQMAENPGSTQPGKAYRLARAMLNTAVEDGLLRTNPCKVKGAGAEHAQERPVAMPGQVAKLAEAVHPKYRAMVLLAAYCSLRFGELAGLRRARVDLLHRTVNVEETAVELAGGRIVFGPPKTAASRRVVSLPPELVRTIEQHLADHVGTGPDALVFTDLDNRPLGRQRFRPLWAAACAEANVSGLHFHDLRGSGATWAAASGATVREVMARLGHTTVAVALRYQHATQERDRSIAEKLGALMRAAADEPDEPGGSVVPMGR